MKITHYTDGYGGKLNYETYCGKTIHSHSDYETADIDPEKVNCPQCLDLDKFKQDLKDQRDTGSEIKRRIYLESDILSESEASRSKMEVRWLLEDNKEPYVRRVFSQLIDFAWHRLDETWEAIKKADEIYSDSSLMPLNGGYSGAPVIFNSMCKKAIEENVTGKDIYILNSLSSIYWDMIDIPIMKKAFKKNNLFMYDKDRKLVKVDVSKIKK